MTTLHHDAITQSHMIHTVTLTVELKMGWLDSILAKTDFKDS